jgi:hypothetical protein
LAVVEKMLQPFSFNYNQMGEKKHNCSSVNASYDNLAQHGIKYKELLQSFVEGKVQRLIFDVIFL